LRLVFHKVSFTIGTLSPSLHEILYAGHIILFAEILQLDKHPAFQLTVVCKILGVHPSQGQKDES
jgi:hypothetical protein